MDSGYCFCVSAASVYCVQCCSSEHSGFHRLQCVHNTKVQLLLLTGLPIWWNMGFDPPVFSRLNENLWVRLVRVNKNTTTRALC